MFHFILQIIMNLDLRTEFIDFASELFQTNDNNQNNIPPGSDTSNVVPVTNSEPFISPIDWPSPTSAMTDFLTDTGAQTSYTTDTNPNHDNVPSDFSDLLPMTKSEPAKPVPIDWPSPTSAITDFFADETVSHNSHTTDTKPAISGSSSPDWLVTAEQNLVLDPESKPVLPTVIHTSQTETGEPETMQEQEPTSSTQQETLDQTPAGINLRVCNVCAMFKTRCHIDLKKLCQTGFNVVHYRDQGMVHMKHRKPKATGQIHSSGNVTVLGATSEFNVKKASRRIARKIQKLGFAAKFADFRIINILAIAQLPFGINLDRFAIKNAKFANYQPEINAGCSYKHPETKGSAKIFATGNITITAPSVDKCRQVLEHLYGLVIEFRTKFPPKKRPAERNSANAKKGKRRKGELEEEPAAFVNESDNDDDELGGGEGDDE